LWSGGERHVGRLGDSAIRETWRRRGSRPREVSRAVRDVGLIKRENVKIEQYRGSVKNWTRWFSVGVPVKSSNSETARCAISMECAMINRRKDTISGS
jgi:hypothetical protein